jgi:predicted DNA-binding protein YlxM (UPF0122 family)
MDTQQLTQPVDQQLDTPTALKLKLDGMSYEDIGTRYGVTKQAVHNRIKRVFNHLEEHLTGERVKTYEDNRDKILSVAKSIIVDEIVNPDKISKSSVNNLAYAYDKLDHAQLLIRGQATDNIGISGVVNDLQRRRDELESKMQMMADDASDAITDVITPVIDVTP